MDTQRKKRYRQKLTINKKRSDDFAEWSDTLLENRKDRLASYKALQEIAEAVNDIAAMMVKDDNNLPSDDYTNIKKLREHDTISSDTAQFCNEITGLRNRLIHEYNGLSDTLAYESAKQLLPRTDMFIDEVEQWLTKH